jgi:Zn finger protein HypA/HybF involved in hydrogenase expression
MWFDCKYCGKDFQALKWSRFCKKCKLRFAKHPLPKSSTTMRMIRNREFITNYKKDKRCKKCGYNKYPEILDFHHKDQKDKNLSVNALMKNLSNIYKINKEIEKCILLCPNCHRILHLRERNKK